jgi:hypothetical protein
MEKDFWTLLTLEMELPEVINTCLCSKKIHSYVCDNLYFWMSKVKKDYGIQIEKEKAKAYYFETYKLLKNYSLEQVLHQGLKEHILEKVSIAIYKNVNVKFLKNRKKDTMNFVIMYLNFFPLKKENENKEENEKINPELVTLFIFFYDKILPVLTKTISERIFWKTVYN